MFIKLLEGLPEWKPWPRPQETFWKAAGSFSWQLPLSQPKFDCSCLWLWSPQGDSAHNTFPFPGTNSYCSLPKIHRAVWFWLLKQHFSFFLFISPHCMSSTLQPSTSQRGCGGTQTILWFFHSVLVLINFLAYTLLDGDPTTLNVAIACMFASIKTFQFTAETTTHCRRTTAPFIPWTRWECARDCSLSKALICSQRAQGGSLGTASWTPNPREATGQLLAGKHQCNYSAQSVRVKKLTHTSQPAQPYAAELLCWHLPPSMQ